jgi:hypothetical protein
MAHVRSTPVRLFVETITNLIRRRTSNDSLPAKEGLSIRTQQSSSRRPRKHSGPSKNTQAKQPAAATGKAIRPPGKRMCISRNIVTDGKINVKR